MPSRNNPKTLFAPDNGALVFAAACAVFVLSFAALLGGFSDGTVDMDFTFGADTPRGWSFAHSAFTGEYDILKTRWSTSVYLFDILILMPLYAVAGFIWGGYLWIAVVAAISIGGWVLLCAALFGKSANRAALVVILHALPFVFMSWTNSGIFHSQLLPWYHITAWASVPWLLWLVARVLQGGGSRYAAGLALFCALSVFSDATMLPWFCAPMLAVLLWLIRENRRAQKKGALARCLAAFGAVAGGSAAGALMLRAPLFESRHYAGRVFSLPKFKQIADTFGNLSDYALSLSAHNVLCAIAWVFFFFVAARFFLLALAADKNNKKRALAPEMRLMFLFVPLSMAAAVAAIAVTGLFPFMSEETFLAAGGFGDKRYMEIAPHPRSFEIISRYLIPFLFFPLFAGWALYLPPLRARGIVAVAVLLAATCAPRIATAEWRELNPYSHPFYECLQSAAKRLNAKSVLSTFYSNLAFLPEWRWDSFLAVGVARGKNAKVYSEGAYNLQMKMKPVDFVIGNAAGGEVSLFIPGREPYICSYDEFKKCVPRMHSALILDGNAVRAAFGEPGEVIECPGNAAIYHYDPPVEIKYDVSKIHSGVVIDFSIEGWSKPSDH